MYNIYCRFLRELNSCIEDASHQKGLNDFITLTVKLTLIVIAKKNSEIQLKYFNTIYGVKTQPHSIGNLSSVGKEWLVHRHGVALPVDLFPVCQAVPLMYRRNELRATA